MLWQIRFSADLETMGAWIKKLQLTKYTDREINTIARCWAADDQDDEEFGTCWLDVWKPAWDALAPRVEAERASQALLGDLGRDCVRPAESSVGAMDIVGFEAIAREVSAGLVLLQQTVLVSCVGRDGAR